MTDKEIYQFIRDFEDNGFNYKSDIFRKTLMEEFNLTETKAKYYIKFYKDHKKNTVSHVVDMLIENRNKNKGRLN